MPAGRPGAGEVSRATSCGEEGGPVQMPVSSAALVPPPVTRPQKATWSPPAPVAMSGCRASSAYTAPGGIPGADEATIATGETTPPVADQRLGAAGPSEESVPRKISEPLVLPLGWSRNAKLPGPPGAG
jgi:hypothetical protein